MKSQRALRQWLWKWHVLAGLITLPFMLLLCVTGVIYLFRDDLNLALYQDMMLVDKSAQAHLSYDAQRIKAQSHTGLKVSRLILNAIPADELAQWPNKTPATAFQVKGKGRARHMVYVNPYSGEITGEVKQTDTFMYTIRKLHGELLLKKIGTLTVELVASWFVVLVLTGLYIWWPFRSGSIKGVFLVRTQQGTRVFWRDLHAVFGFWLSVFMLAILAGGMPWTDVFGSQLKWVQKHTDSGLPSTWRKVKIDANESAAPLSLEALVALSKPYNLLGEIRITLPKTSRDAVNVSNRSMWLSDRKSLHFNPHTGALIKAHHWDDVGVLMDLRMVFMQLHQGRYGLVSWLGVMIVSLLFTLSTVAGLVSYVKRKPKGSWGIPTVPDSFRFRWPLLCLIVGLGVLFPMFGGSVLFIIVFEWLYTRVKPRSFAGA